MESSSVVKIGLLGGAAFLAYRFYFSPSTAAVKSPAATPATVVPAGSPHKLDDIYSKMVAAAAAEGVGADGAGLDAWNVYLIRGGGPSPAPSPEDVFGSLSGADRTRKYPAAEYWAGMAPWLKAQGGYAGLGLFGSLCCGRCS